MTETAEPTKTPRAILEITRKIFAASHWIEGSYTGTISGDGGMKVVGCSVGGLRYAALAPMDHALDETWMVVNFENLGEVNFGGRRDDIGESAAEVYLSAVEALAAAASPFRFEEYELVVDDDDDDASIWERITSVEDIVVTWNDSFDYDSEAERLAIVEEEILPAFDTAIANLSAGEQSNREEN